MLTLIDSQYTTMIPFGRTAIAARLVELAVVLWTVGALLGDAFLCWPIRLNWDNSAAGGHCANIRQYFFYVSLAYCLLQVAIIVVPMPALSKLKIPIVQKLGIMALFGIGFM